MASAQELLKQAILGISSSRSPGVQIKTMGEECASELAMNPQRDGVAIIVEKAKMADLNRNQIERLVEVANHEMIRPVLKSNCRSESKPIISKTDVFERMGISGNKNPPEYNHNSFSVGDKMNNPVISKTAGMHKLASTVISQGLEDYLQDPVSLGDFKREEYQSSKKDTLSKKAHSRMASYAAAKRDDASGELEYLDMVYRGAASEFGKIASQYVLTGTPMEDIIAVSLHHKPEKSTISLLKIAANTCYSRGIIDKNELVTFSESLDYIKNHNPYLEKSAKIGIPVSDSLIANDIKGRVRIINGDSHIIKMLDTVGRIEDRIRKAKLIEEQIPEDKIIREHRNKVSNVSDNK